MIELNDEQCMMLEKCIKACNNTCMPFEFIIVCRNNMKLSYVDNIDIFIRVCAEANIKSAHS